MKRLTSAIFLCGALFFASCEDVLEEDISDDMVIIIAPTDNAQLEGNSVQFRWNALEGAEDYRLQITGDQQRLILDSLISTTLFEFQIDPGSYQWRIRAENFAYVTPFTFPSDFSISASEDLSGQVITLNSPANKVYLNNTEFTFSWQGITTADSYHFQLLEKEGSTETQIYEDTGVVDTSLNLTASTIIEDSEYIWQVRAQNSSSNTAFFKRSFFVDRQSPPAPTLTEPADEASVNVDEEVTFLWNFQDTGDIQSPISATIEIASDENFNSLVLSDTGAGEEFTGSFTSAGTFYWRVSGKDEAGNSGAVSEARSFDVN